MYFFLCLLALAKAAVVQQANPHPNDYLMSKPFVPSTPNSTIDKSFIPPASAQSEKSSVRPLATPSYRVGGDDGQFKAPYATRTKRANDALDTPAPTGAPSDDTTVHIKNQHDFALLLPSNDHEQISAAENDALAYCTHGSSEGTCKRYTADGFILAAAFAQGEDGSYVQVTGCLDTSKFPFSMPDQGGQFDVRFPNGAQCTFGGYKASFIEQVEPNASRFCLRCCASPNDQVNCNSHHDKEGCLVTIPGTYDFPEVGVACG